MKASENQPFIDQVAAFLVQEGLNQKEAMKLARIAEIQQIASEKMQYANTAIRESLHCIENVRDFVSDPSHILGDFATKHGEIAEHIEVEIRNGRDILKHLNPNATFDNVGRTAPEDYIINGKLVQSKFLNGLNKSLTAVKGHLDDYPWFTSEGGYYHIPKDQYELLMKVANGESLSEIHPRTVMKCKDLIASIENSTGKPLEEVIRPGVSTYSEVQLGKVGETLDNYETEFYKSHDEEVSQIRSEERTDTEQASHITDASWGEALKYSAVAAAIQGGASAGIKIYSKIKGGKKFSQFSLDDWKEIGFDFAKGGAKGGISGLGIYGLTKGCGFSAPFAGAMVGSAVAISSLMVDYKKGKISKSEFADSANVLTLDAGFAAVGSAVGQALIPIPALGAIIGYAVSKSVLEISKYFIGKDEEKLIQQLETQFQETVANLDAQCKSIINDIEAYFAKLGGLIDAALSKDAAARLYGSAQLCTFLKVKEDLILRSVDDVDKFIFG